MELHHLGEILVLIRRDQVHACCNRCLPPRHYGVARSEVVGVTPAAIVAWIEAIQRVKANPIAELVGMIHQRAQTALAVSGPGSGFALTAFLHGVPRTVP